MIINKGNYSKTMKNFKKNEEIREKMERNLEDLRIIIEQKDKMIDKRIQLS